MNAMRRFLLALKGLRAPVQDDDDRRWPLWADDEEDPSFRVIRNEAAQRASNDLQAAMARGEAQPKKRLGVITTADVGGSKKAGQK
jgi:hypothetical protein